MAEKVNAPVQEIVEVPQEEQVSSNTYKEVVKNLIASGCKRFNRLKIKNVTPVELDNYTRVSITLTSKVPGFVSRDNGTTFEKDMTNIIFTSLYALVAAIKENEDLAWMAGKILDTPNILPLILCGSEIDILQREYEAGTEIKNPYSTRDDVEGNVYDHDVIINDVIDFHLGKTGEKMADKLADKMLGF